MEVLGAMDGGGPGGGGPAAQARIADLRHALATEVDEAARSRLRLRLVDHLSAAGDGEAAVAELRQAVAEGQPSAALRFALAAVAPHLTPAELESVRATLTARRPAKAAGGADQRARKHGHRSQGSIAPWTSPGIEAATSTPAVPAPGPAALTLLSKEADPLEPDALTGALAALAEGKLVRARRLGEEATRLGQVQAQARVQAPVQAPVDDPSLGRWFELITGLERAGAGREALRLERSSLEDGGGHGSPSDEGASALEALAHKARRLGEDGLASRWAGDVTPLSRGRARGVAATAAGPPIERPFLTAQRAAFLAMNEGPGAARAIAALLPLLGGHAGSSEALRLAERLLDGLDTGAAPSRVDLLARAFEAEPSPRRRASLARRRASLLQANGDSAGAAAVLGHAIQELPAAASADLRRARADLLRATGDDRALARALDDDAGVARGAPRVALLAEQARLLDLTGDPAHALEVRLVALEEAPADLSVLTPARHSLEGMGRLDRSLELAAAAVPRLEDRGARAVLLRDVATLAEAAAGDLQRAAQAWLDVLGLDPGDHAAFEAAERLLRRLGDQDRLEALLAWSAVREEEPRPRVLALWRLAEFRRLQREDPLTALPLYREIVQLNTRAASWSPRFQAPDEDWQRRDDALAVHTARALAAPTPWEAARAAVDRADALMDVGRVDDAEVLLGRALELDAASPWLIQALERLHEGRGDPRALRQKLTGRLEGAEGRAAAQLWLGIGRADERAGDPVSARAAYRRAAAADETFRPAITRLRQLITTDETDWQEVASLLEKEIALTSAAAEKVALWTELGTVLAGKLSAAPRGLEALEAALALEPAAPATLDAMFNLALTAGAWEKASAALEALLGAGLALADTSQRYHRLGLAAEKAGQPDRALAFYSRSYARNPVFRPTLERLSEICFERQQWDNAWKATEHLIERHGADMNAELRAGLALRAALADLHVAQRLVATNRLAGMISGSPAQSGLRDVADSWASMRFDPRLLAGVDGDRRARVLGRLREVVALTDDHPAHPARSLARETLAALALVEHRWADALGLLDQLGGEPGTEARRRCLFLVTAGDLSLHRQGDATGAALRYARARALNPNEARLSRPGMIKPGRSGSGDRDDAVRAVPFAPTGDVGAPASRGQAEDADHAPAGAIPSGSGSSVDGGPPRMPGGGPAKRG